jgi:hypothetical protein
MDLIAGPAILLCRLLDPASNPSLIPARIQRQRFYFQGGLKLYGFENISANNGWAMAAVGATIVFLGLVVLSLTISQLYKLLYLIENRGRIFRRRKGPDGVAEKPAPRMPVHHMPAGADLALVYRPLAEQLEAPFQLARLYEVAQAVDLPHPHLSIQKLRDDGFLVARGDGAFIWKK